MGPSKQKRLFRKAKKERLFPYREKTMRETPGERSKVLRPYKEGQEILESFEFDIGECIMEAKCEGKTRLLAFRTAECSVTEEDLE
mmetsp:Transcript_19962/g.30329  ORF Transcript_19962/g.30329 Transcript_19962/m.30329 type:complete len:86 (-) Transcript_19962:88-345(-)